MKPNYQNADMLDMIFEHRNKSYGAYMLRKDYGHTILQAVLITFTVIILLCLGKFLSDKMKGTNRHPREIDPIITIAQPIQLEDKTPIKLEPQNKPPQAQALSTQRNPEMTVVADNHVNTDSITPLEEMRDIDPGLTTNLNGNNTGIENGTGDQPFATTTVVAVTENKEPPRIVEVMPEFPGGEAALLKFLRVHTEFPPMEREMGIGGKVISEFTVNEDGRVSDIKIIRSPSPGFDKEVIKVAKMLPAFKPGMQQGRAVKVRYMLPFTFATQ